MDGSIAYAPRNDYGEQRGQDGGAKETDRRAKENLEATPRVCLDPQTFHHIEITSKY